jgi:hypothetical protein
VARGSKATKEAKRRVVAKGVVAGKCTKEIARAAGCKARHVERLAAEPKTQLLITDLLRPYHARLEMLAKKAIHAVDVALAAKYKGQPDHMARLRAVGRYAELLELAQGTKVTDAGERGLVTWEQFVVLYRGRSA